MTSENPSTISPKTVRTIALAGNPNTGKTTLFNVLTGFRQRVANYPGVTVERKSGLVKLTDPATACRAIDLPGSYSLNAQSADEAVVLDVLLGHEDGTPKPDLIVCVIDATALTRNLFFTSQLLELGVPVVVALNMVDLADRKGIAIDAAGLAERLGAPVVPIVATKKTGIEALKHTILEALDSPNAAKCPSFPGCVCAELDGLHESVAPHVEDADEASSRAELLQTLLDPGGYHERRLVQRCGRGLATELAKRRERITDAGESIVEMEAKTRYAWIDRVLSEVLVTQSASRVSRTDRADRVLTHPVWGAVVLVVLLGAIFQSVYTLAEPVMDLIDSLFGIFGGAIASALPPGPVRSLVDDGIIAGVGAVLVFLPQILVLFLFIALLEDCGYMARAALLLDRWMRRLGLNGKSFIPLLSSFACAVPGIMAARTIEDRRGRLVTILIAPLMSCSARLPVYVLLIAAFVPSVPLLGGLIGLQAVTMLAMYSVGTVVGIAVAWVLNKTILKGEPQSFLMELPTYNWPTAKTVLYRMYEQGREFCLTAGTIIFAVTIVVWALGYYPRPTAIAQQYDARRSEAVAVMVEGDALTARLAEIGRAEAGEYLRQSFLGRMGAVIEPAVKPLGWDWRIGTAVIAAFPAREVVIATMGTVYNLGKDQNEESATLRDRLHAATWPDGRKVYNTAVALSIMVFFALCCQCGATLATIKRETNSWRWPLFTFVYMTGLAYLASLATYQIAIRWV